LGFDRRKVELLGHTLDISNGVCDVSFLAAGRKVRLRIFAEMAADRLWLQTLDAEGQPSASIFDRVCLLPDPEAANDLPPFTLLGENQLGFEQRLPFLISQPGGKAPRHTKDRAVRVSVQLNARHKPWNGPQRDDHINFYTGGVDNDNLNLEHLERRLVDTPELICCLRLEEGLATDLATQPVKASAPQSIALTEAADSALRSWQSYWRASGVKLGDEYLERVWYRNLYFFNCAVKPGVTCPGLWANWSYRQIGTAWHGDYHLNYNVQQPFWAAFSSNHVDKHLPYVDLVDRLLPVARKTAQEYFGLRGAYFPHSAYPVEMNVAPFLPPGLGWEICETPWAVQSLWWHYLYTMDRNFLRDRAFGPIREAVLFLVDYMRRPEAHDPERGDDRYHIFPTMSPELHGLTPGLNKLNTDCVVDLTLTRFVFRAYLQALDILGIAVQERELASTVRQILAHFPDYPTAQSEQGQVFVSVAGESPDIVYNTPNATATVFPGEEHGLHSPADEYRLAANTYRNQLTEGTTDLVFRNLQGARLGLLDLEQFKRYLRYCEMPNGTFADMALQVHGRWVDTSEFDKWSQMGIWFENFALPVVINECLLQSYSGALRFFPNWSLEIAAEFRTLRAAGGFLVSAACAGGRVKWIEITSEAGAPLEVLLPWRAIVTSRAGKREVALPTLNIATEVGEVIRLVSAS
jgi:hypothetical protein